MPIACEEDNAIAIKSKSDEWGEEGKVFALREKTERCGEAVFHILPIVSAKEIMRAMIEKDDV